MIIIFNWPVFKYFQNEVAPCFTRSISLPRRIFERMSVCFVNNVPDSHIRQKQKTGSDDFKQTRLIESAENFYRKNINRSSFPSSPQIPEGMRAFGFPPSVPETRNLPAAPAQ